MNILLIHNYYRFRGGEETYVHSLDALLRKHGHRTYLYTKDSRDISEGSISKGSIAIEQFWNEKTFRELDHIIQEFRPDIAHFNNISPLITPTAYHVCKKYKIPIVQTIHNYKMVCPKGTLFRNGKICELCAKKTFPFPSIINKCYQGSYPASIAASSAFYYHILKNTYDLVDTFLFPSQFTYEYHIRVHADLTHKSTVLPYFVEDNKMVRGTPQYFLYLGRFSEEKGIRELLELFATIPKASLIAAGDGPLKSQLKKKYNHLPNISLLDSQSSGEMTSLFMNAICLIIPSQWYEVLPFVYLEAMSMGIPVLTPKTEVFTRTIASDKEFYYTFGNFSDLKEKVLSLLKSPKTSSGERFYSEFLTRFTPEAHYSHLEKIYHELI